MGPVEIEIMPVSETRVALSAQFASEATALRKRWFADREVLDSICRGLSEVIEDSGALPASEDAAGELREETTRRLKDLGLALFQELLKQEGDRISEMSGEGKHTRYIIFKIDRSLAYLPVEMMFDGTEFLSRRMAMGRVIYAENTPGRPARDRTPPYRVFVAGDPSDDPAIRPDVESEIDQLRRIFTRSAGFALRIQRGPEVTRQSILTHLPGTTVFHFTGHGVARAGDAATGIKLGADKVLGGEALSGLQDPPGLAFLNMCTPVPWLAWKGALGLVETLLARGTRACVASLWDVRSAAATRLASCFYERLFEGETFGHALRMARTDLAEAFGPDAATWAAYTLYGDPRLSLEDLDAAPAGRGGKLHTLTVLASVLVLLAALLFPVATVKENLGTPPEIPVGYLVVESIPADAAILIDGQARGMTPSTVEVAAGNHRIILQKQGYRRWEAWIEVKESAKTVLEPNLVRIQ